MNETKSEETINERGSNLERGNVKEREEGKSKRKLEEIEKK